MENVNNKNKKLTIIVGALLLVVGISFAYFIATTLINGKGSSVVGTTARIKGAEINIEGTLEFNDTDVYPGHKNVSAIKVTATGNNQLIPYNLIWKGESGISQINFTVYKSATSLNVTTNCTKKTGVQNGMQILSEECTITNIDTLGEAIASGSIIKAATKEILVKDEFITALNNGSTVYYYVVLEYHNLDEDQSNDANAVFNGEVTVEESNKEADINILAVYVADDNGNYTETTNIPQSGYTLNSSKSTCSNGTTPGWDIDNSRFYADNLTKSGTSCYLYFDEYNPTKETLAKLNITDFIEQTETVPNFANIADTDEGIFKVADGMYGGYSYYWRGAATTNYLKFAGFCWRIVRINGDGSIRLIYDGTTCHANGTDGQSDTDSVIALRQSYSKDGFSRGEYVGYTYTEGIQRPIDNNIADESNLKSQNDIWYNNHIKLNITYDSKVAEGKFCNDRETKKDDIWSSTGSNYTYAAQGRLNKNYASPISPTLNCLKNDIYTLKVGAITADEAAFAGAVFGYNNNNAYYLYNSKYYWTMSPAGWGASNTRAYMFLIYESGCLWSANGGVDWEAPGVRPVINLRSDIQIKEGTDGTLNNPYEVL